MFVYALFIILYVFVAWCKPKWALFLICALLPIYQLRFQIFNLPTTFLETMILVLFISWFIKKLIENWNLEFICKLKIGTWKFLIIFWLIVGLVAVSISPDKWVALGHWRAYFLEPILLLLVVADLAKHDKSVSFTTPSTILFGLSLSALICSAWTICQKITGQGMESLEVWQYPLQPIIRPTGPFPHSNFLGLFLGPLIIVFFGKFVGFLKNKKLLSNHSFPAQGRIPPKAVAIYYLLVSVISALAIVFAKSEGAILAVLAGLIFFFLLYFRRRLKLIFVIILLLVASYLLFFSPWQEAIYQKITFQDLSLQLRLNIWRGAWRMIMDSPVLGVGLRGYQQLVDQYQQPFFLPGVEGIISNEFHPYPHNLFLTLWVELGILGLIFFLLIVFQFFKMGFKELFRNLKLATAEAGSRYGGKIRNSGITENNKILIIAILSSMVVILIHGLIDTPYFKNDLAVLFWLIVSFILVENNSKILENK